MELYVKFLGKPEIFLDGVKLELHQKKLQALLLYLLFNGSCTRDELSALFWCNQDEESAKRNLRNSLYKLKLLLGDEMLVTKGNVHVKLHPDLALKKDTDLFITENSEKQILELQDYSFLDKFYIKNCVEFEKWVLSIRNIYEKMATDRLLAATQKNHEHGNGAGVESCAKKLLELDPYNERACRLLLCAQMNTGMYNDAIAFYTRFADMLYRELDTQPEPETQELYQKLLGLKKVRRTGNVESKLFRENLSTVVSLTEEYHSFLAERAHCACVVSGSVGMRKTETVREFLRQENISDAMVLEFTSANRMVDYYAMERIVAVLSRQYALILPRGVQDARRGGNDSFYLGAMEYLLDAAAKSGKKRVLLLQNLEFVDEPSLGLLLTCLFEQPARGLFLAAEFCPGFCSDRTLSVRLSLMPGVHVLTLHPLTEPECQEYLGEVLRGHPELPASGGLLRQTGGNLMLLGDIIHNVQRGEEDRFRPRGESVRKLEELLSSLGRTEYAYLEYLSVLENGAEISALAAILGEESVRVLDVVDCLVKRGIASEAQLNGHVLVQPCNHVIRELVYRRISEFKRVELHRLAAAYYEERCRQKPDVYFYIQEARCHSHAIHDAYKALYYDILNLEYVLDYYDEFFPTIKNEFQPPQAFFIGREDIYKAFEQASADLVALGDGAPAPQVEDLQMRLNFLLGRTLNRDGKREIGIIHIRELIAAAEKAGRDDLLLKGYIETLCYGVKTENYHLMREYVARAKKIRNIEKYEREIGILLRLESYCLILNQEYEQAEALLHRSIAIFQSPRFRNTNYFNVAGAYNYLALTYRFRGDYDHALECIGKAINLCREHNVTKNLDIFYEDYGYVLFLKKDYEQAEPYFKQSMEIYDSFDTYWLRSVAESCMAMISVHRGDNKKALEYFRRAEIFSRKEMTKEELTVLETARQELKQAKVL